MAALFWGLTLPFLAFLIQLLCWRIRLPRYQTKAILVIFILTAALGLAALAAAGSALGPLAPQGARQYLHILLLHGALGCAWIITYSAFEADSPTLVLVQRLLFAGEAGLPAGELLAAMSDEVLILPRVYDLERDALATLGPDGRYRIAPKGRLLLAMIYGYRRLLRDGQGG
ncbi:MAG TPA: hypothetical protein PKB11_10475 [Desulfovibrio sp.]|uniref:hypothetical protein n=1 Tax=Desulfovibrio sp. TaxID=885 RepID=UPI002BA474A6|nr:hypothetical protein [Desulfovibrio sp.]HMM39168.1 hypothetical protein [Desulfovibrio sp.]